MKIGTTLIDFIGSTTHFTSQLEVALKDQMGKELVLLSVNIAAIETNLPLPKLLHRITTLVLLVKTYIILFARTLICSRNQLFIFNTPLVPSIEILFVWLIQLRSGISVGILHNEIPSHGEMNRIRNYKYAEFYNCCDVIVFHDSSILKTFDETFPNAIPVFLDLPSYKVPNANDYKNREDLAPDIIKLAILGTIRPYKNLEVIFPEFEMLDQRQRKSLSLRISGKAFYDIRNTVRDLEGLCLGEFFYNDEFLGDEQFYREMADCDFLLLPHSSSSGSALLSVAASLGIPIIGSKVPVVMDFVDRYRSGVIFDHLSRGDLFRVVSNLVDNRQSIKDLKENAMSAVDAVPNWDDYVDAITEVCKELAAQRNNA